MPFVDEPTTSAPSPAPAEDDLYAPFQGAYGMGAGITAAPLDVGPTEYSDIPKALAAGWHGTAADFAGSVAAIAPGSRTGIEAQQYALQQQQAQAEAEQGMSPAAQRPGFLAHPLISSAEALPGAAAVMVPAAIGSAILGPVGAGIATSTLMGTQQLGGAQNRAVGQGIELTPGEKATQFGIGAVSGVVPELNVAGKIATGPLAKGVLEGGIGAGTFGAAGIGSETVSETGEIGAGKREGYDPSAILTAGGTQALQGAGVGLGVIFHGKPKAGVEAKTPVATQGVDNTATGGEVTNKRTPTDYRKPGVTQGGKPPVDAAAPRDKPTSAEAAGPPPVTPENKGVGPAENAALNPEPVTPRVSEPPVAPVEQPAVVQPEPPPAETAREAPPAPDTTGQVGTPQPEPEVRPTPVPAPPREDVAALQPESDATRREQFAALIDKTNPRDAMVYDLGVQPFDLPNKKSYGQTTLADGRIVQFYKYGLNKLINADKVNFIDQQGGLKDILQLGPVSKEEGIARAQAGETPAIVTERTPAGTEVKGAVGTTETAPAQQEALELTKTPGNVTGVERPEDNLAAQQAAVAQEQHVQPQVVPPPKEVTPEGKLPVAPAGRVLEAQDEAGIRARNEAAMQAAQRVRTVEDELKRKNAAKEAAAAREAGVKGRSHAGQEAIDATAKANETAQRIVDAYPHTGSYADTNAVIARAKAIAREAGKESLDVPKVFGEGHPWNAAMVKIREAKDLLAPIKKHLGETREDKLGRFIDREHMIDTGRVDEALEARRAEGAQGLGSPEGGAEGVRAKGGAVDEEGKPTEEREGEVREETPTEHATGEGVGGEERAPSPAEPRERPAVVSEAKEGEHYSAGKAAVGFKTAKPFEGMRPKVEGKVQLKPKRSEMTDEEYNAIMEEHKEHTGPGTITTTDSNLNIVGLKKSRTISAEEGIKELYNPKDYTPWQQKMHDKLVPALLRLAGHVDVHFASHDDMVAIGQRAHGYYDPNFDHIVLNADYPRYDTMLHELTHAAIAKGLERHPELMKLLQQLRQEAAGQVNTLKDNEIKYAFKDPEEFLVYLMTNKNVHEFLKNAKISADLAKAIGIPKWRKQTMWEGVLSIFRQTLGLGPRDTSVIEAAMALTEHAMWAGDPGMAMEAAARYDRATAAEGARPVTLARVRFQEMDPDEAIHERADEAQKAVDKPPGFWHGELATAQKTGAYQKVFGAYTKGSNTDSLRIDNEHLFGDKTEGNSFRRAQEGLLNQGGMIQRMLKNHDPLMQRLMDMKRMNPNGLDRIITLLSEAHDYKVHPDEVLGAGLNEYIKSNPKSSEYDYTTPDSQHEAILAHPRLSDEFNNSTPEEQRLFQDLRDTLMEEGHKSVQAGIKTFTQGVRDNFAKDEKLQEALKTPEANRTPADIKRVERYNAVTKILDGDKLEGDEAKNFNDDPHIKMIRDMRGRLKQEGPHFPGTRKGDWVVNVDHELPKADNAVSVKDNEVTFANEKDAYDYRQKLVDQSLPSRMEKVSAPTSTTQQPGQKPQYKVTVQLKHSSAVNDVHEGRKLGDALRQMGLKNVTEPMLREKNPHMEYGLNSGTLRAMDHAIDALTYLGKDEKAALKEANEQASLGLMRGNRVNRGVLTTNRVRGANADPVLAVQDYLANNARSQARSKTQPDIDKAMEEMRETTRNVQDKDTWKRGMLVREMEDRVQHFGRDGFTGQMSPMMQKLTTFAYLKDMMAPIHYAIDLTHQYLYSMPQIAGRHGWATTHAMSIKTLSDMGAGGVLGKGIKGLFKAAAGHAPTDLIGGIRDSLVKNGATADELKAFDNAKDTHLSSIITDYSKAFDRTGALDRGAQYLQNIGNEMSHAVDAVNRVNTYMTAYRLERAMMGKPKTLTQAIAHHAQAVRYAKDTVSQTQNLYSAANRSSFMRDPKVRAVMQFRAVPMMIYRLLAKNVYNAVKGETPEIRRGAVISLVSTMGATAALAGAAAGVPEPIRLAVEMSHALGLTGSWQDYEDKARTYADNLLGKFGGHLVMDGVLGAAGLDANSRIGLQDLMVKNQALASPKDFLLEMVGGAYTGYLKDEWTGVNNLLAGNYAKGIPGVIPIRIFSDIAKAYAENQEGIKGGKGQPDMTPLDPYETFIRAAGGTPTREALYRKESDMIKEDSAARKQAITAGASGNMGAVTNWNMQHPNNRITAGHILKARQAGKANRPLTPHERANQERYSAYQ